MLRQTENDAKYVLLMLLSICLIMLVCSMVMWMLPSSCFVTLHKAESAVYNSYILFVFAESFQCKDCYGQGNVDFHLDEVSCMFYVVNFHASQWLPISWII